MFSRSKFHAAWQAGNSRLKANCHRCDATLWLYNTCILDWSSGLVKLFTGGWRTAMTKAHINEGLRALGTDAYVQQIKGEWFVTAGGLRYPFDEGFEVRLPKEARRA